MKKKKKEFNGICPECGEACFEMNAKTRAIALYDVEFKGNKLVEYEFCSFEDIDNDDIDFIYKNSQEFFCKVCGCVIDVYDLDLSCIKFKEE